MSDMEAAEAVARRPPTHLQQIKTTEFTADLGRRKSLQGSGFTKSPPPLPSPNVTAAHAYYLDKADPMESNSEALLRRRSLVEKESFPQQDSLMTPSGILVNQFKNLYFPPAKQELSLLAEFDGVTNEGPMSLEHSSEKRTQQDNTHSERRDSEILHEPPERELRQVPFEYTHEHLREWGYAYLGNSATADAFVIAVSLRRPTLALQQGDTLSLKSITTHLVTVRARVLPKSKARKPFIIQRQLDIDELRCGISSTVQREQDTTRKATTTLRRSTRLQRGSARKTSSKASPQRGGSVEFYRNKRSSTPGKGPIPIHIEYALHYLPVLGALMLSGHVRKGDTIELPIPQPEAWRDVVSYIYTGKGEITGAIRENITFLAGHT